MDYSDRASIEAAEMPVDSDVASLQAKIVDLQARLRDSNLMREQAQAERNRAELAVQRIYKDKIESLEALVEQLRNQAADGWKHPEEVVTKVNELEAKNRQLRSLASHLLNGYLYNLFDWIEEDETGQRLELLRPELERLAHKLTSKDIKCQDSPQPSIGKPE